MRAKLSLVFVLSLLFVWSLPNAIAWRHSLIMLSLLLLVELREPGSFVGMLCANKVPVCLFAVLTGWLLVQAVFISDETLWALKELKSQWMVATLAMLVGIYFALASRSGKLPNAVTLTTALMGILILQAAIAVGQSVFHWFSHGELLRGEVPLTGGKLEMSYLLNIVLAALTIDLLRRAKGEGRFLRFHIAVVAMSMLIVLVCAYLAGSRNGVIGVMFLSSSAIVLFVIDQHRQRGWKMAAVAGAVALLLVSGFAISNYQGDSRWQVFSESAAAGWDIDHNRAWIDTRHNPWPLLSNGEVVDNSAYLRVAFIHSGLRLIADDPLGVGYGRNAFAHALRQTQEAYVGHSHSGFIDLTIGGGLPAFFLWLAFVISLMVVGIQSYFRDSSSHGLLLFFLTTGYSGRMLLDSVNRDHMLQIFLFFIGYLLTVMWSERSTANGAVVSRQ
jgi:hypothetical protein